MLIPDTAKLIKCLLGTVLAWKSIRPIHTQTIQEGVAAQEDKDSESMISLVLTTKLLGVKANQFENMQFKVTEAITKDERQRMCCMTSE